MRTPQLMQTLLVVILMLCGYLYLLQIVTRRASNKNAITVLAIVLFFIYAVLSGALIIILSTLGSIELILMALLLLFASIALCMALYGMIRDFRLLNKGMLAVFLVYVFALAYITFLSRETRERTVILMVPFASLTEAIRTHNAEEINHMLLNVALFVPMGMLFPMIYPEKLSTIFFVLPMGMMCTTLIESLQLILRLGHCDIDDIIANTLGTLLGYLFYLIYRRFQRGTDIE